MRTTVDKAGRVVLPKNLRLQVGLTPGEVEIVVEGSSLRISPVTEDALDEVDGLLMLPDAEPMSPDDVRDLRLADQP
jgi:AbrB family looped-hinge helix DNA binding protein